MELAKNFYSNKDLRIKYCFFLLNCFLTLFHQIIYNYEPGADSLRYIELANQYKELNFFDPVSNCYGHSLYALFILIISGIFSYNHFIIGIIQTLIFSVATIVLVNELEVIFQKKIWGILILVSFIPEVYFFNGSILTESISFSLIIYSFYLALKIHNTKQNIAKYITILGIILSINALNRIETAVTIFPVLYLIYPSIKHKFFLYTSYVLGVILLSLQWNGYRNYKIYGIYKLSAFNGGEVVYGGNNENLDGSHHVFWISPYKELFIPKEKWHVIDKINLQPPHISFPQRDSLFFQMALEAWKKNPVAQLTVIPNKLAKNWLLPGMFDIYTSDSTKTKGLQIKNILSPKYFNNTWYAPYKHAFYILINWTILLSILIGILKRNKSIRFQSAVLMLLLFWVFFAIPFCGLPRWHVAIFPLLLITFIPNVILNKVNMVVERLFQSEKK